MCCADAITQWKNSKNTKKTPPGSRNTLEYANYVKEGRHHVCFPENLDIIY